MSMDSWSRALDRLEADLLQAEALAQDPQLVLELEPWTPPTGLGPLPPAMADRARGLLERQRATGRLLAGRMDAIRRQRGLVARITQATGRESRPVYIDHSA